MVFACRYDFRHKRLCGFRTIREFDSTFLYPYRNPQQQSSLTASHSRQGLPRLGLSLPEPTDRDGYHCAAI